MDHADLLVIMEEHISQAKEEARSRKDIMEKVEKWMASCEEEQWLEEYSKVISKFINSYVKAYNSIKYC